MSAGGAQALARWVVGRDRWLVLPSRVNHLLAAGLAGLYFWQVLGLHHEGRSSFFLAAALMVLVVTIVTEQALMGQLPGVRALARGAGSLDHPARLAVMRELRGFPLQLMRVGFFAWAVAGLALAMACASVLELPRDDAFRVACACVLLAPAAVVPASMETRLRVNAMLEALAEGMAASEVVEAIGDSPVTVRSRLVGFTVTLVALPPLLVVDVGRVATREAALALLELAPAERGQAVARAVWTVGVAQAGLALALLALVLVTAALAADVLGRPMRRLAEEARQLAEGRIGQPAVIAADGEIWLATRVFARTHERLVQVLRQLLEAGTRVVQVGHVLDETSRQYEGLAADQASALNETSVTTEELATSARQVALSAGAVQELADRTQEAAESGRGQARSFQEAVERMQADNKAIARAVQRLEGRVQQIGRVVDVINGVADRSQLLALSAELEGTRAGELGRGFSLVASEMRRLAENVLDSTAEVETLIEEIRSATQETARATTQGSSLTERGLTLAAQVSSALDQVAGLATETSEAARSITLATQQQQSGTGQLAEAMSDILSITQQNLSVTRQLAHANIRLQTLSRDVGQLVERLHVVS